MLTGSYMGRLRSTTVGLPPVWWLNPIALCACLYAPIVMIGYFISDEIYVSQWGVSKYFYGKAALLSSLVVGVFVLGYFLGDVRDQRAKASCTPRRFTAADDSKLRQLFWAFFLLSMIGYIVWVAFAIQRGAAWSMVLGILNREHFAADNLKQAYFRTVPGLTTLTQFGMAAAVIGMLLRGVDGWQRIRSALVVLVCACVVRAFMLSERLAMIEILVPMLLIYIRQQPPSRQRLKFLNIAPPIGAVLVYCLFTVSEMFRSWTSFYSNKNISLLSFSLTRLFGYYATALNNSALVFDRLDVSRGYFTVQWLWKMPVVGNALGKGAEVTGMDYGLLLQAAGNPEFNNVGGFLLPFKDWGIIGGIFYWVVLGIIISALYRGYLSGRALGTLMYPLVFVGLLEIPRILYFSDGRSFPSLIGLVIGATWCGNANQLKMLGQKHLYERNSLRSKTIRADGRRFKGAA